MSKHELDNSLNLNLHYKLLQYNPTVIGNELVVHYMSSSFFAELMMMMSIHSPTT